MRIATTYEKGEIFQHFGHTERFKIYDIENGKVTLATVVNTNGSGHGALADILNELEVEELICGGIGAGAKRALSEAGITFYGGVSGNADEAVEDLLKGSLKYDPEAACTNHGEHHHDKNDGASCKEYSCGDSEH